LKSRDAGNVVEAPRFAETNPSLTTIVCVSDHSDEPPEAALYNRNVRSNVPVCAVPEEFLSRPWYPIVDGMAASTSFGSNKRKPNANALTVKIRASTLING
jgi:hypothetical protein